jgi:hypothetical protein
MKFFRSVNNARLFAGTWLRSRQIYLKQLFLLLTVFIPAVMWGQDNNSNTIDTAKHYTHSWHALSLRAGVGIQKSFYVEIGPSLVFNAIDYREGFGNGALYAAFEWIPSTNIYGAKIGGEMGQNLFMGGLDLKILTDNKNNDVVITPKIGLGLGFVNLYYGYNFSTNKYPFSSVGRDQFSIVFNITKKYFK